MCQFLFEPTLILAGFFLGYLTPFMRDVIHHLRVSPHDWREVLKSIRKSWVGLLFTAIPLCALLVFAGVLSNARIEAEKQRDIEIINSINQAINQAISERDDKLIEAINKQTEAILKAIQQNGGRNGE